MPSRSPTRSVAFSNLTKVFFPASGFTKGDLIRYYLDVAEAMIPHLRNRAVTVIRMPDGVTGEKFYEKNAPRHAPPWLETTAVAKQDGGVTRYLVVQDARSLAWCANHGAVEFHPFLHRVTNRDRPTHAAFDLDPGEGADLLTCLEVAFILREILARLGLESYPKVSGSKGLQLYVPFNSTVRYDRVTLFAHTLAELAERQHPDLVVSRMSKALRRGKVLIDWSQNHASKTTVSVYSIRGKREEPFVSAPVGWLELERAAKSGNSDGLFFSPAKALRRLAQRGDLFAPVLTRKQKLPAIFLAATATGTPPASLRAYRTKRDFTRTAEPAPAPARGKTSRGRRRFVVQKHQASHLHYDFRLELDGVLKSWAVPKGLSTGLGTRRAAIQVEDHPLAYAGFEGTIPRGQYGGGTVMVLDHGTYELLSGDHANGHLKLRLAGKKFVGEWHLFRIKTETRSPTWLIVKAQKPARPLTRKQETTSVLTGRTMEQIAAAADAVWRSKARRTRKKPRARRAATRTR